jgi:H+-translocating NAD(P) transhydrogenase subunit alpha
MMLIGLPKEKREDETRVGLTPDAVKKLVKKGFKVLVERSAGFKAGFPDEEYQKEGAELGDAQSVFAAPIVLKVFKPTPEEIAKMKKGTVLVCYMEPYLSDGTIEKVAAAGIDAFSMELIPRTSRAQSMDALSSQANIAGYRAVIEAARNYNRFVPLMMTSAGSAKAAKVMVLGAGVAGLQAIATAKRLGAVVEAYDIRPEVKEQIQSLGAKFVELDVGEAGVGEGGYAKELSAEGKQKQQALLTEKLKKSDIIISTANVPGRKAPILITEEAVKGMRAGSVIVDMAAANGGNCPLSEPDRIVVKHNVKLIGFTNYSSMMAADSSTFYGNNLVSLLGLIVENQSDQLRLNLNLEDDIVAAALVTHQGSVRLKRA